MTTKPIRIFKAGQVLTLHDVPPTRTLLEVLREDLHCTGTKEGCGEGDCGACTVVIGENVGGALQTRAINSCIRMAHSVDGMALWTVEDLSDPHGDLHTDLHPVQQAMVECHASQCGFCTPGFVMSLFALYEDQQGQVITREQAQAALSGNLCRCTGYRPILDAAVAMQSLPPRAIDAPAVLAGIAGMAGMAALKDAQDPAPRNRADTAPQPYLQPRTLAQLLRDKAQFPQAQLVAGCTDVGLWVTKMHMQFARVIDTTRVAELRRVEDYPHHIAIGAAVTLTDAFAALVAQWPQLDVFAHRFAGLPVRNSGTLGGNVANGSPIGDSMPLLIALGANIILMREHQGRIAHREMPLESLYTGYRKNVMAPDEVLAWIKVPKALPQECMRVYKISKRFEDDISAVCLAIRLRIENGEVTSASIGVGGVAATPVRAVLTEAALRNKAWSQATAQAAAKVLQGEFTPISDMRASADYRSTVLGNLLQRFWMESQGLPGASLTSLNLLELPAASAQGDAA